MLEGVGRHLCVVSNSHKVGSVLDWLELIIPVVVAIYVLLDGELALFVMNKVELDSLCVSSLVLTIVIYFEAVVTLLDY